MYKFDLALLCLPPFRYLNLSLRIVDVTYARRCMLQHMPASAALRRMRCSIFTRFSTSARAASPCNAPREWRSTARSTCVLIWRNPATRFLPPPASLGRTQQDELG